MVLRKVELTELFSARPSPDQPLILAPQFLPGPQAGAFLAELGHNDRSRVVLEIGELAVLLEEELAKAPIPKRGRQ